jgi:hypothetical protein
VARGDDLRDDAMIADEEATGLARIEQQRRPVDLIGRAA